MVETIVATNRQTAGSAGQALVQGTGVQRVYHQGTSDVLALREASFTIAEGDRIALMGPSGSGKSTLLHLIAGLDVATGGALAWPALGGRETLRPSKVGVVFQTPSLLEPLNVVENVELPLLLRGSGAAAARAAALDALLRLDLAGLAERLPEELSGGQAQRVGMARALATQPLLLLADEPTGRLDHQTATHALDVLLAALEGTPTALLVATHDVAVAERMNTIWRMQHGLLEVEN
ncbi:MAG: ATP-binding cassette domain-containing protein [Herpetosiphon sp.]